MADASRIHSTPDFLFPGPCFEQHYHRAAAVDCAPDRKAASSLDQPVSVWF